MTKLIFGCGYLGRRVANAWSAAGDKVHVVTRSPDRAAEFQSQGWTAHVADICDAPSLATLPAVDTVLFAVGFDRQSGRMQREVMVDGVAHVLAHYHHRCRRFIYISSTSVYGQHDGEWVDESSPTEPTQPGGQCCLAAERLVWNAFPQHPVPSPPSAGENIRMRGAVASDRAFPEPGATVLRLAGIYGPQRLLACIEALQRGESIAGNPDAWLNLIHVDDAVAAILACEAHWSPGETYLVCDNQPITRREYFAALAQRIGAPPPTFDESQPPRRGSGGLNKRCCNRKLHERLDLLLRYPTLETGLPAGLVAGLSRAKSLLD